ncbi:MAG: polysaccharide biosynthesis tyrosine autokinase [Rhizobiaceae bacterium]
MHQKNPILAERFLTEETPEKSDDFIDLEKLLAMGLRRARIIALCAAVGLLLGVAYLLFTPSEYTATTTILLDNDLAKYSGDTQDTTPAMEMDSLVLSEVEVLKSERLARTVVAAEKLDQNQAFLNPPQSPIEWAKGEVRSVLSYFAPSQTGGPALSAQEQQIRRAIEILQTNLDVERVGRSFVITLSYDANDKELATSIAQAYAQAYLTDQLNANFDATERAATWLQGRIAELRTNSQAAALEVERYRAANGLNSTSGQLLSDQQLSDLNKQLILAQADTANARARYMQFKAIVDSGPDNAVKNATIPTDKDSANSSNNSIINDLRSRYLDVTRREQEIESRFGKDHPQAVALRAQQAELEKQIFQELKQLTESYRNQYQVAKAREDSLRNNVDQMTGRNSKNSQSMVHLHELEQKADALSALYQSFLSRHAQALQQSSFPIAKARVISKAMEPTSPSRPRKSLVLGLSLVLGIFAGVGFGGLQEFRERFFRTGEDVRAGLDLSFFGYLPRIGGKSKRSQGSIPAELPADSGPEQLPDMPRILRIAANAPSSSFAETLRNAKLASDIVLQGKESKVLSFLSVLPREGKTTVAANFAELLAASGVRTLLIDGDLRNPSLSRSLSLTSQKGLVEVIVGEARWQDVIMVSRKTGLAIIPAVVRGRVSHTSELLSGPSMRELISEARKVYDYIVIDLPPIGPVVDAKAFEPLADGFVMVAEWGATPRALVRTTLNEEPQIAEKVLGIILNKTDMKKLARYGKFGGSEQYLDRYSPYYTAPADGM